MSEKENITGRNSNEHLYRVYALRENYVIKDLNKKDTKELTSPGVLVQARDTNGVLLTYNDLVNSADLRKELTGLGPNHFQNLRLERLGEYELAAVEQQGMVQELKDKNAIIDMHKLEDQTLNTFFFKNKEELVAHLTGRKKIRQYSRKTGKEIIPTEYANIPCMFDREIIIVEDGYSLGFINPLDTNDTTLPCPVVGYFEAFKEKIKITDKKTKKVSEIEVSKADNSGRVIFCHCFAHGHTEEIIISGRNYRYSAGEILIGEISGVEPGTEEIKIAIAGMDTEIDELLDDKVIIEINGTPVTLPVSLSPDKKEIIIDTTGAGITFDTKVKITIKEGALKGTANTGEEVVNDEKVFTITTESPVVLVDPVLEAIQEALTPAVPHAGEEYEFDIKYKVTENDATSIKVQLIKDNVVIGGDRVVVDEQEEVIHITVPVAESIQGSNKWTVKYFYDLGTDLGKELEKEIEVMVAAALVNPTMTGNIINLTPSSVKPGQAFAFDFDLMVNMGDATNAVIKILDEDGNVVGTQNAVDGSNVIHVTDADGMAAGNHTYKAVMTYKVNNVVGTPLEVTDDIMVSSLVAPILNSATENHTGVIKKGQSFTFNSAVTITKNDATDLKIKIMNGAVEVGSIDPAANGVNNFTNLNATFNAIGNQVLDVVFEYKLGGVAGQLRDKLTFTVADLVDATLSASIASTNPDPVKVDTNFDMVINATVAKNDATSLTSIEILDGATKVGSITSVVNGLNTINCTSVSGIAGNSKSYTVKLTYILDGTTKTKNATITVNTVALVDPTISALVRNIVPANPKESMPFTFDVDANVVKNDGVLTKIEVSNAGTVVGSTSTPVNGNNVINCSSAAIAGAGNKTFKVTLFYTLGSTSKTVDTIVSITLASLTQPSLVATVENLNPDPVKVGQALTFDIANNVTVGDATNVKLEVFEGATSIAGPVNTAVNNSHLVIPISHAAYATDGVKTFTVKMTYDLGTLTGLSVSKNVTVTIAELVAPTMLSTITPTTVKQFEDFNFTINSTVVLNDAENVRWEVLDGVNQLANKTTVTASMSHSETNYTGITTTGNHAFTVLLHYELNGVAQTDITNTVNVNVTAAVDSVLSSVSTPSDVETGKGPYVFNLTCAVAENDGALVSLVAECDGNTIGTLNSVVDGNNTLACTVPDEATETTKTITVTLNYTMGGTNKTSVKTVSLAVKKPAAAKFGYIGYIIRKDLVKVYPVESGIEITQLDGIDLASRLQDQGDMIKNGSNIGSRLDPMTDISIARTTCSSARGFCAVYPAAWTIKEGHFINDAGQDVYPNQVGHFTCTIDGAPMKGIAFTMSTAQASVDIKFNKI